MYFTREWVEEKYNYYNDFIWGGRLPEFSRVKLTLMNTKSPWGRGGCDGWTRDIYGVPQPGRPVLMLSNYYDAPEWVRLNTLVHEMCHIYERFCEPKYILDAVRYGRHTYHYPSHGHGTVFYEQARRVQSMTDIQIERFVSQDKMAAACVSEKNIEKFKRQISERGGAYTIYIFVTHPLKNSGFRYGYVKPAPGAIAKWESWFKSDEIKNYFKAVAKCSSSSPEAGVLATRRTLRWNLTNNIQEVIDKYDIHMDSVVFGDVSPLGFDDAESVEPETITPSMPVEKRYKVFTLRFTSGKLLQYKNVTKAEVASKLRQEFPKWPDATIEKFVNDDKLYTENTMKEKKDISFLVEKTLRRKLDGLSRQEEPTMTEFSDEDMQKLQMLSIVED